MTPDLERAARAACWLTCKAADPHSVLCGGCAGPEGCKDNWEEYEPEVRAALQSLREPSEEVSGAMAHSLGLTWQDRAEALQEVSNAWQAAIDRICADE